MTSASTSAFILPMIRAGRPAAACAASRSISSMKRVAHVHRRDDQLAIQPLAGIAGERVEQIAHVRADRAAAGEQSDVGVEPRRARVVVAAAQVDVTPDAIALAPDDERRLGVRLQRSRPERDVNARVFELARPDDVVRLVEARLELDDHRHLLAALRRLDERRNERRIA